MKNKTLQGILVAAGVLAAGSLAYYELESKGVDAEADARAGCAMPACWTDAGVWDESMVVDCKFGGHLAWGGFGPKPDDGLITPKWLGCSVQDAKLAVGTACVPVPCVATAGERPERELLAVTKDLPVKEVVAEELVP